MRTTRRSLADALRNEARREVPPPSDAFIDGLEQGLFGTAPTAARPADNVLPFRRRVSRGVAIGVVAAVVSGAGAAAVAIVHVARTDRADGPTTSVRGPETSEPVRSPSRIPAAPSTPPPLPASTEPATATTSSTTATVPAIPPSATTNPAPPSTAPPSTAAATAPPTTPAPAPVTTAAPAEPAPPAPAATDPDVVIVPPSTEVRTPATLDLTCTVSSGAITCTWSPGPDGTDHYALLRSTPSEPRGHVFFPAPGETSFVDTTPVAGQPYTYLVHALDGSGHSVAHSSVAQVTCCG